MRISNCFLHSSSSCSLSVFILFSSAVMVSGSRTRNLFPAFWDRSVSRWMALSLSFSSSFCLSALSRCLWSSLFLTFSAFLARMFLSRSPGWTSILTRTYALLSRMSGLWMLGYSWCLMMGRRFEYRVLCLGEVRSIVL